VKEDPTEEKKALSTLVNHPAVPFLPERFRLVGLRSYWGGGIESLEALEAATFGLVALEVCWLVRIEFQVVAVGSIGEVETFGRHYRLVESSVH
jgi:hypothetical protein